MSNYSDSEFNYNDENSSWYKTYHLIPEKSEVIDIGCSIGTFGSHLIKEKNCIVDGIELDVDDYILAKQKLRNVYNLNIESDNINLTNTYDVVFMGDVVEHLARPVVSLKKIKKLLKPEGKIVFSIPNITHMSVRLMLLEGRIQYGKTGLLDETHLHFYNQEEIVRVFGSAGFMIKHLDTVKRDIPRDILEQELEKIGLKIGPKFEALSKTVNAAAYQFVGVAVKGSTSPSELPIKSPINIYEEHLKKIRTSYERDRKEIVQGLQLALRREQELHEETKQNIKAILNSRSYKLGRTLLKGPGTIKARIKGNHNEKYLEHALQKIYGAQKDANIRIAIIARSGNISPTSSAFLRLISPLTYGNTGEKVAIEMMSGKTVDINDYFDICIVQRTAIDNVDTATKLVTNLRNKGIKLIVDTDDAFSELDESHPQYEVQKDLVEAFNIIKTHSDRIWVSSERLEKKSKPKRSVIRNSVDDRVWKLQKRKILQNKTIKAVYMGTATHDEDFSMIISALEKINAEYKNKLELTVIGVASSLPERTWLKVLKPPLKNRMYPYFVEWFTKLNNFDIGLAPLVDSDFNKAKSDIKVLDYLSIGVLPIVSDLAPYQDKELDKFVIRVGYQGDEWYKAFKKLIENQEKYAEDKESALTDIETFLLGKRSVAKISSLMLKEMNDLINKNES